METIKAYVALTKPRVIELLLVATIPAMLQAERGENNIALILLTVVGGWMGAAAANTFNMVADSDIDQKMGRTRARPLVRNKVSNRNATIFAWTLLVVSVLWLGLLCGSWLAAFFIVLTNWFYIFVYTKWLKRRTWQNIIWGGAAGCMPVMVGWAVIVDNLPEGVPAQWWQAIVLWLIVFFWTPPHTWALAFRYREDYAAADVPMLPVVMDAVGVARRILAYTVATVATTLALWPVAHTGWLYPAVAAVSGAWFIWEAWQLLVRAKQGKRDSELKAMRLFHFSNSYIAVLFLAIAIDPLIF